MNGCGWQRSGSGRSLLRRRCRSRSGQYFNRMSAFAGQILELNRLIETGETENWTLEQLQRLNRELYADILPENYGQSYGNPAYAAAVLGDTFGQLLSFLYSELRAMIVYAYEQRREELVISLELLVEIYNAFEGGLPGYREVQQIIYWFTSDYCDVIVARRVRESVDPELDFAAKIIRESDLEDSALSVPVRRVHRRKPAGNSPVPEQPVRRADPADG